MTTFFPMICFAFIGITSLPFTAAFSPIIQSPLSIHDVRRGSLLRSQIGGENEEDWRNFRAKLVMKYRQEDLSDTTSTITNNNDDSSSSIHGNGWAYESGQTVEIGSIILSRPPDPIIDGACGLAQQYFHKSIILVLGK